jgi:hypothetical protein
MGRLLRFVPENSLVEITCRTVQARYLLKPVPGWSEIFIGALARAQRLYPVDVHAFVCLSNHFHLLVSAADACALAGFMRHLLSKLSIEAGRLHGWRAPLFERRYQAILVSDEARAQIQRLRYLLSHGVKENLVRRTADWPGPHAGRFLIEDRAAQGIWLDRTSRWKARRRSRQARPDEFERRELLMLAPLPCWAHLPRSRRISLVTELVELVEQEAGASRTVACLGVRAVLRQHPHDSPICAKRSPAPYCHAFSKTVRKALRSAYALFLASYRHASQRLADGDRNAAFPHGCFPPPLPFIDLQRAPA